MVNQSAAEVATRESDAGNDPCHDEANGHKARTFKFLDLVAATQNFKAENFLGEGGFGKVYKGYLPETGEVSFIYLCIQQINH